VKSVKNLDRKSSAEIGQSIGFAFFKDVLVWPAFWENPENLPEWIADQIGDFDMSTGQPVFGSTREG
jgi:hypothetical protein